MWKMWSVIIIHVLLLMWWRDGQGQEADEGEASRSWRPMWEPRSGVRCGGRFYVLL